MKNIKNKLNNIWPGENETIAAFSRTVYCELLMREYDTIHEDVLFHSYFHGPDHIERTMLNGALIAWKQELSNADTTLLLRACAYHDIGRNAEGIDSEHGRRAAKLFGNPMFRFILEGLTQPEIRILKAMVAAHSMSDVMLPCMPEDYEIFDREERFRYLSQASYLKDADGLDRFRLGDLDPGHLRNMCSVELLPVVEWCFHNYGEVESTAALGT